MKLVIALSFFVACVAAGTVPVHPGLQLMPLAELENRITNGEVAKRNEFPYQVGLSLEFGKQGAWCGGSLWSTRWIGTAAHCTSGADGVIVYLGAFNIKDANEVGQQRIHVSKSGIFTHEKYDASTISNDIAVIKLPNDIKFNEYIQPIALPRRSNSYSSYVGDKVVASGWGKDSDSANSVSPVLNYIDSVVISKSSCNLRFFGTITDNVLCISGKEGRSTCNGDSGGPLAYNDNGEKRIIGITSYGIAAGCEVGWPAVFTRVTSFLEWIDDKTKLVQ